MTNCHYYLLLQFTIYDEETLLAGRENIRMVRKLIFRFIIVGHKEKTKGMFSAL